MYGASGRRRALRRAHGWALHSTPGSAGAAAGRRSGGRSGRWAVVGGGGGGGGGGGERRADGRATCSEVRDSRPEAADRDDSSTIPPRDAGGNPADGAGFVSQNGSGRAQDALCTCNAKFITG
ncbi:hypothetical protein Purlil1_2437 [Purpureocillium lilacinum]|uniref:Uncharacterized protein n=1 Tax=Purpureocillium lilacinum TaxID=33203 RepID=A0ABR0CAL8_PURLI|nr:hypothetical protein Purlil1_2437 [Purpureocillium lilacinum]